MPPITNKVQMFDMLARGMFGNIVPQWFDVAEWKQSAEAQSYPMWGVRTLDAAGPCRLFCPREEVEAQAAEYQARGFAVNLSVMIDCIRTTTLWAEVYDYQEGRDSLRIYGIERPPHMGSWRALMPSQGREWSGLAAHNLLRRNLTESSLADLWALFDLWPEHVVELSAVEGTFGTVPGRNAVIWEVRKY